MKVIECAPDWFSVYHNGCCVADFSTREAAERYVRSRGYFVTGGVL